MTAPSPGQAAYETVRRLDDGPWDSWEELSDRGRAIWEAAAQAAIDTHLAKYPTP